MPRKVYPFSAGNRSMADLLGGKGANLSEMAALGIPVPDGFREHGGDPRSIDFFHNAGLDYVSCSPFRVPVARLEAGRSAVSNRATTGSV